MKKALMIGVSIFFILVYYLIDKYYFPPKINLTNSDVSNKVTIQTEFGNIVVKLKDDPTLASAQFTKFARSGYYNQTQIHRIVPQLMIEGGDPITKYKDAKNIWGQVGSSATFKIKKYKGDKMEEGTVVMTDTGTKSYGSHFGIITKNTPWMVGRAEIVGKVIEGMDIVKKIEAIKTDNSGTPEKEIVVYKITE